MNVLLVSVDFPPHNDGVSSVSEALAQKLVADGHRLLVVGPKAQGDAVYDRRQPYRVLRSPGYDWGYLRFIPLAFVYLVALVWWRPKAVFAMNIAYGGILAYALRFLGYNYYLWAYGYEFHKVQRNGFLRGLYRRIYARAQKIFVISNFVGLRLKEFGVAEHKMQLLHPGVDSQRFRPLNVSEPLGLFTRKEGEKVVLSVSRLVERKGVETVIRALPAVLKENPNVSYWIAGQGPMRPLLEDWVHKLQLEAHVRFLGRVRDDQLVQLYNQCDVFVMPSKESRGSGHVEGWGIVFLEANACGKPVIGGRSGGMPEAIEEGRTGLLVNPEDIAELSQALTTLLSDEALAKSMGSYGRQRVLTQLNWEATLNNFDHAWN